MKSFKSFLEEAKATPCGRCGTTHVPPSEGGTCPALEKKEELEDPNHGKVKARKRLTSKRGGMLKQEDVDEAYKDMTPDERDKFAQSVGDRFRAKQQSDKVSSMSRKRATSVRREESVDEQDKTTHPQGSAKFYRGAMDKYKAKTPKKSHWDMYMDKHKKNDKV